MPLWSDEARVIFDFGRLQPCAFQQGGTNGAMHGHSEAPPTRDTTRRGSMCIPVASQHYAGVVAQDTESWHVESLSVAATQAGLCKLRAQVFKFASLESFMAPEITQASFLSG